MPEPSTSSNRPQRWVSVAVDVPVLKAFTYAVPARLDLQPGLLVHVPFRNRSRAGVVLELLDAPPDGVEPARIKAVADVLDPDPLLAPEMIELARFIARYYRAPIGEAVFLAVPTGLRRAGQRRFTLTPLGREYIDGLGPLEPSDPVARARVRALAALADRARRGEPAALNGPELQKHVSGLTYHALDVAVSAGHLSASYDLERQKVTIATVDYLVPGPSPLPAGARLGSNQLAILRMIENAPDGVSIDAARAVVGSGVRSSVAGLTKRGLVAVEPREQIRDPMLAEPIREAVDHPLTEAQRHAIETILDGTPPGEPGGYRGVLLHGVTGSGKTEVYIRVIRTMRERGLSALVLLPEIALTPQFCAVFRGHFGDDVAVLHSGLTPGERYDAWRRLRAGEVGIAIGARSALFAPVPDLGVIVVDEEHDGSFKQGESPRYHARDMALMLGHLTDARVILGSATPSLESWQLARAGRLDYLPMPERVGERPMPAVEIVDMTRDENLIEPDGDDDDASQPFFRKLVSKPLAAGLAQTLERREQAIVLLNRRGHSTFVQCLYCGHALYCPNCAVSLTYHKRQNAMRCHLCDHIQPLPRQCPECTQPDLGLLGVGTERLTAIIQKRFPDARVERLDRDTGSGKRLRTLLHRFRAHEIDVLVGTQMVAKGHDIHNVTLVGVVMADMSLNFPDFRASERTFQLLAQVAGRAGRGERPGRVLIQTLSPSHEALTAAQSHSYDLFVGSEMPIREALRYPPFGFLIACRFEAIDATAAERAADRFGRAAHAVAPPSVTVLGPAEAPLSRVRGRSRYQLMIKSTDRSVLRRTLERAWARVGPELETRFRAVRTIVDIDPLDML